MYYDTITKRTSTLPPKREGISWGVAAPTGLLAANNILKVVETPAPEYDPETQTRSVSYQEQFDKAVQTWAVSDINLASFKEGKIARLRSQCADTIYSKVPAYVQANIGMGIATQEQVNLALTFIPACQKVCNDTEALIEAAESNSAVVDAMEAVVWPE